MAFALMPLMPFFESNSNRDVLSKLGVEGMFDKDDSLQKMWSDFVHGRCEEYDRCAVN